MDKDMIIARRIKQIEEAQEILVEYGSDIILPLPLTREEEMLLLTTEELRAL